MPLDGEYGPSPAKWVRDQVDKYEGSGGTDGTLMRGMPVVIITMRGVKSGKVRKVPVMRVEHDGVYAAVASRGGAPTNPVWYHNLVTKEAVAREVFGDEKATWWERAVAAYPDYADYQLKTARQIPVFVLE